MVSGDALRRLPVNPTSRVAPLVALDVDFEKRWRAWVGRGRVHEQRAQRRFSVGAAAVVIGAVIVYAFVR
jgi:hypothetical protein